MKDSEQSTIKNAWNVSQFNISSSQQRHQHVIVHHLSCHSFFMCWVYEAKVIKMKQRKNVTKKRVLAIVNAKNHKRNPLRNIFRCYNVGCELKALHEKLYCFCDKLLLFCRLFVSKKFHLSSKCNKKIKPFGL